ncbi:MAG: hypothetical protein AAFY28_00755 [Actinomycetota bacterium]
MSDAARSITTSTTAITDEDDATHAPATAHAVPRLRAALGANALFSAATGAAALVGASPLGRFFEVDDVLIRVIGATLVAFAGSLALIRRIANQMVLRAWALAVSIADIGWVLGTIVVIASGAVSQEGAIVLIVIAFVVAELALTQLYYRSRVRRGVQPIS